MKKSTRNKMQMKSLHEFQSKHRGLTLSDKINELNKKIHLWNDCPLCHLKENKIESGECYGKLLVNCLTTSILRPTFLFVGLAPSYRRFDKELRAFRGVDSNATLENFNTSGDLFRLCLEKSKINEYGLWVTNLVKCSTPNNRDPTQEEIDNHFQWLLKEIEILDPSKIIALGNVVYDNLISRNIKNVYKIWHPAYCMRDRTQISAFIEQLNSLDIAR